MPAKTAATSLDDLNSGIKLLNKRFDKLDRDVSGIGMVLNGLSTVVHALVHDLKDLRIYTEAGFDTMNGRFDYVDDRFDGMDKRMDDMDDRFDGMDDRFDSMDKRMDGMDDRFNHIDKRMDGVDGRFDRVDDRFDRLDSQFGSGFYEH